jgi:hypothetical protein
MSQPQCHLAEAPTAFERELLEAARGEMPDAALEQYMLAAMTGTPPGPGMTAQGSDVPHAPGGNGPASSNGPASVNWPVSGKWAALSKWGLGVLSAGLIAWLALSSVPGAGVSDAPGTPEQPAQAMALHPSTPKQLETTSAREAAPPSDQNTRDSSPPSKRAEQRTATPPPLHDELRLLERTRVALAQGRPELAMSLLSLYEKRHPTGQLRQEATVLRVQALDARGQSQKANALAEDFVEKNPHSAHAPRVARERGLPTNSPPLADK